jgi:MFS family permease
VTGAKVLTDRFAGREIATAMSFLGVAWPVGIALGLSLLPLFSEWLNWRAAVYLTIILPALSAVTFFIIPLGRSKAPTSDGEPEAGQNRIGARLWTISRPEFWLIVLGGLAWPLISSGGVCGFFQFRAHLSH